MRAKANDDEMGEETHRKEEEEVEEDKEQEPEFTIKHFDGGEPDKEEAQTKKTFWQRIREKWAASCEDMKRRPWTYISIPIVAGLVGYITNYIGIKMLFYPINWTGIPLMTWPGQPFGLFGW